MSLSEKIEDEKARYMMDQGNDPNLLIMNPESLLQLRGELILKFNNIFESGVNSKFKIYCGMLIGESDRVEDFIVSRIPEEFINGRGLL